MQLRSTSLPALSQPRFWVQGASKCTTTQTLDASISGSAVSNPVGGISTRPAQPAPAGGNAAVRRSRSCRAQLRSARARRRRRSGCNQIMPPSPVDSIEPNTAVSELWDSRRDRPRRMLLEARGLELRAEEASRARPRRMLQRPRRSRRGSRRPRPRRRGSRRSDGGSRGSGSSRSRASGSRRPSYPRDRSRTRRSGRRSCRRGPRPRTPSQPRTPHAAGRRHATAWAPRSRRPATSSGTRRRRAPNRRRAATRCARRWRTSRAAPPRPSGRADHLGRRIHVQLDLELTIVHGVLLAGMVGCATARTVKRRPPAASSLW